MKKNASKERTRAQSKKDGVLKKKVAPKKKTTLKKRNQISSPSPNSMSDTYIATDYMVSGTPISSPQKGGSLYVCNGINVGSMTQKLTITDGAVNCLSVSVMQNINLAASSTMNCNNVAITGSPTLNGNNFDALPPGVIMMWCPRSSQENVPDGWVLCDGNNSTPDLRDRFVIGAGHNYNLKDKGGNESVTLNVGQLPAHTHNLNIDTGGPHSHDMSFNYRGFETNGAPGLTNNYAQPRFNTSTNNDGQHSHTGTATATGGGASVDIRPPFFALYFIMKKYANQGKLSYAKRKK